MEQELGLRTAKVMAECLGSIDTFRFEEAALLTHCDALVKYMTGGFASPGGRGGVGYVNVGLMNGDIFVMLLEDLEREGWNEQSDYVEAPMKGRADRWNADAYTFGSEMAWDSTGQEEIRIERVRHLPGRRSDVSGSGTRQGHDWRRPVPAMEG